jgi:NAD(P)H-dependent flavin oxidoreductase YrpB (nitropropane dioxygenase family)
MNLPIIIQGGMGVAISDWKLAKAVSQLGQMGVVSGTGIALVLSSRLAKGDLAGHMRRALANFALPEAVQTILDRYYIPGGQPADAPHKIAVKYTARPPKSLDQFTAIANFVEVFLAKENHAGLVGINLLEKVQMPTLASLYGAMLAGVDYVLMGAGIPTQIARILDKLANHEAVSYRLDVHGASAEDDVRIHFDPATVFPGLAELVGKLKRPKFLPIISSVVLAQALIKRSESEVNGFIIEGPTAGGHNAPPRGPLKLNDKGEPIYGDKDTVDLGKMQQLGLPFWLAGGYGHPAQVKQALEAGAAGVQVGTAFALCDESGLDAELKTRLLRKALDEQAEVFTSPIVSPTGFPFKVAQLEGTLSDPAVYEARPRICDTGYLQVVYKREDGSLGYRCAAEPVDDYVKKGGKVEDTVGRSCLCNGLGATAGLPQHRKDGYVEKPIITTGDDLVAAGQYVRAGKTTYSARDVIEYLLSGLKPGQAIGTA